MAVEAGLLPELLKLLEIYEIEISDEAESNHAVEACKTAIKILARFVSSCPRMIKSLRRFDAHLKLVNLLRKSVDIETLGLLCVSLGHMVCHDPHMCAEVLD